MRDVRDICDQREWPITADVISMCYRCGIPSITPRSYLELFTRIQLAYYANRIYHSSSKDSNLIRTRRLTIADIHRRIGIVTAADSLSRKRYMDEVNRYMIATIARQTSKAMLAMHVNKVIDLNNDTPPVDNGDRSSRSGKAAVNEIWLYAQSRLLSRADLENLPPVDGRMDSIIKTRGGSSFALASLRRKRTVHR